MYRLWHTQWVLILKYSTVNTRKGTDPRIAGEGLLSTCEALALTPSTMRKKFVTIDI